MDTSWITPSLIVALLSLWVAFFNFRRSNYAVVRVRECSCSFSQDVRENGGRMFGQFRIVIQNLGIPLHNLHMTLGFRGKDGSGRWSVPLKAGDQVTRRDGQFAKGMITDFWLKSYQLERVDLGILCQLEDVRKQAASLCLYADGFLVWEYRLDGLAVPAKRLWNRLAGKLNYRFKRQMGTNAEGHPIVKFYTLAPTFISPSGSVTQFAPHVRKPGDSR